MLVLRQVERAVIVVGTNLDIDAVASTWRFCQANQLAWWNPEQMRFLFVQPGERRRPSEVWLELGLDKVWTVVHLDTGRINNPNQFYFDHHSADGSGGGIPSSTAHLVMRAYPSDDQIVWAIMNFAHWVDNARGDLAQNACRGDFDYLLNPVPKIISSLCGKDALTVPPEVAMQTGLGDIQAFYASCRREKVHFEALADQTLENRFDGFVLYGTTGTTTKNFRNFIMRQKPQVHVVVASYPNEGNGGRIGVSCLRPLFDGMEVINLAEVRSRLAKIDPGAELFLHDSGKFLYIEKTESLTLEAVWQLVEPMISLFRLYESRIYFEAEKIHQRAKNDGSLCYEQLGDLEKEEIFNHAARLMDQILGEADSTERG